MTLLELPNDVIRIIVLCTDLGDYFSFSLACKKINQIYAELETSGHWVNLFATEFPFYVNYPHFTRFTNSLKQYHEASKFTPIKDPDFRIYRKEVWDWLVEAFIGPTRFPALFKRYQTLPNLLLIGFEGSGKCYMLRVTSYECMKCIIYPVDMKLIAHSNMLKSYLTFLNNSKDRPRIILVLNAHCLKDKYIKSEFLYFMDTFRAEPGNYLVIETSKPKEMEIFIRRRCVRRKYLPYMNDNDRSAFFQSIQSQPIPNLNEIVQLTEGRSMKSLDIMRNQLKNVNIEDYLDIIKELSLKIPFDSIIEDDRIAMKEFIRDYLEL